MFVWIIHKILAISQNLQKTFNNVTIKYFRFNRKEKLLGGGARGLIMNLWKSRLISQYPISIIQSSRRGNSFCFFLPYVGSFPKLSIRNFLHLSNHQSRIYKWYELMLDIISMTESLEHKQRHTNPALHGHLRSAIHYMLK